MRCYGYLFGVIQLLEDTHHSEVFVEQNGHVIMRNNQWLCSYKDLIIIARSLGVNPWKLTLLEDTG